MEHFDPFLSYGEKAQRAQDVGSGDMVVVYEASLSSAGKAIELLRKQGLGAVALEQSDPIVVYRSHNTMLVRIAVPKDQARFAGSFLRKWQADCSKSVAGLTGRLRKSAFYSCAITALVALGLLVFGYLTAESATLLIGIWLGAFAIIANAERISQYFKKDSS